MTCNGNNHRPGCNCRWGGVFHGLGLHLGSGYWSKSESYTTPNAPCKTCGKRVFFYRSPHGGSVYFESLGPPWPKHPCMGSRDKIGKHGSTNTIKTTPFWKKEGWHPLSLESVRDHRSNESVIVLTLINLKQLFAQKRPVNIHIDAPALWRRQANAQAQIEISTVDIVNSAFNEIRFQAFENLDELLDWINFEQRAVDTKAFDTQIETLATELLMAPLDINFKAEWDHTVAYFRQQLQAGGTFPQILQDTRSSLLALVNEQQRKQAKARLTIALDKALSGEIEKIVSELSVSKLILMPELKKSRKQALVEVVSIEAGKELMWQAARRALELQEKAEQSAALHSVLKAHGETITSELQSGDCDLQPSLFAARKEAVAKGMSIEAGKELMWQAAHKEIADFDYRQERNRNIALLKAHAQVLRSDPALGKKVKQRLDNVLNNVLTDPVLDVELTKSNLENVASTYLKAKAARAAAELEQKSQKKAARAAAELEQKSQKRHDRKGAVDNLIDEAIKLHPALNRLEVASALSNWVNNKSSLGKVQFALGLVLNQQLKDLKKKPSTNRRIRPNRDNNRDQFNTVLADKLMMIIKAPSRNEPEK